MGWLLCFLLILVALIGGQFSPADHDSGHAANKTRTITGTARSTNSAGDPAISSERAGAQPR